MSDEKKSITLRLEEPDICEWLNSQSSGVASVKTAIKIAMFQYGKDRDLLDAILEDKFRPNGVGQMVTPYVAPAAVQTPVQETTSAPVQAQAPAQTPVETKPAAQAPANRDALASLL